ncbi:AimR family lysis-lysogeny pheromone receptor [Bacillus cereus group sp. BfR-BA-00331]|uniref:AimR family lysis-lysogeny pheromone receptor n=1 Tax=Bacillus cereus group TaxID=86661 RepID=UPI0029C1FB8E|nr:AimR family lysis-lysogeny pheromone receptor [Bacillus cereus group sp. BfR-BA-00331]MDX5960976.1 AimR family lysis-lysogeny pheromone receptor [Bacillus cereus group sp. BfR-BA-00331]
MEYWLANIIDQIDFQRKNRETIAKSLGISGPAFSKNLSGKTELGFLNMVKLVEDLFENPFEKAYMIHEFCRRTNSKKNIRIAMEYGNALGDLELLRIAIQRGITSNNVKTYEWACVYELVWMRSKKIISNASFIEELEERKKSKIAKNEEMKIMLDILTLYTMYDLRDFKILNKRIENLQCKIEKISNKFIRDLYSNRVREWYAYALLMDEQIEKSREVCHSILNVYDDHGYLHLLKVSALGYLGESYVDNYEQAIWYLNKGINLLNQCQFEKAQNRKKDFLNMRSYLRMIHGKEMHDLQIYDEGEWSLYYIVTGNRERAIHILRNKELIDGSLSPMKLCYLGWALEDREILKKSIELFCSQGCKFYSYLPRKMLVDINKNGIIYTGDAK